CWPQGRSLRGRPGYTFVSNPSAGGRSRDWPIANRDCRANFVEYLFRGTAEYGILGWGDILFFGNPCSNRCFNCNYRRLADDETSIVPVGSSRRGARLVAVVPGVDSRFAFRHLGLDPSEAAGSGSRI